MERITNGNHVHSTADCHAQRNCAFQSVLYNGRTWNVLDAIVGQELLSPEKKSILIMQFSDREKRYNTVFTMVHTHTHTLTTTATNNKRHLCRGWGPSLWSRLPSKVIHELLVLSHSFLSFFFYFISDWRPFYHQIMWSYAGTEFQTSNLSRISCIFQSSINHTNVLHATVADLCSREIKEQLASVCVVSV